MESLKSRHELNIRELELSGEKIRELMEKESQMKLKMLKKQNVMLGEQLEKVVKGDIKEDLMTMGERMLRRGSFLKCRKQVILHQE